MPGQDPELQETDKDPLARFRNWRGFLFASIAVNVLFVYGMLGNTADQSVSAWYKALIWLPFNAIATVLYLVFLVKLSKADAAAAPVTDGADQAGTGGVLYVILCLVMIAANWIVLFSA